MRIALWIALVVFGSLFLMAGVPWVTMREFRRSSRGREFLMILLILAVILWVVISNLLKGPVPAAAP